MTTFRDFLADLSAWDWTLIALASWLILAALVAPCMGRALRDDDDIRQPDDRCWQGSDGRRRTEAEALAWAEATYGASVWRLGDLPDDWDATALPEWVNDHNDVPDYIPQEWSA